MPRYRARYSRWDGSQNHREIDPEEVVDALSDDLLQHGDLQRALRNLSHHGFNGKSGYEMRGLQDMRAGLQRQRRDLLSQHHIDSLYDDLKRRLRDLVKRERSTVEQRLKDANADNPDVPQELRDALRKMAERNKQRLDTLPPDPAAAIQTLRDHEFLDPQAGAEYQELLQMLQGSLLDAFYRDMQERLQNLTPAHLDRVREMTRDLNGMLERRMDGENVDGDYQQFREQYQDVLGPNAPDNLDAFLQQMYGQMQAAQSLLNSLSEEQREGLLDMLGEQLFDAGLQAELRQLAGTLRAMSPFALTGRDYRFYGDEQVNLSQALDILQQLQDIEALDHQLEQARFSGQTGDVDPELAERLLGETALDSLNDIGRLRQTLEEAGLVEHRDGELKLTGRAARAIGQRALADIFADLKTRSSGSHTVQKRGPGVEQSPDTKDYEFGDPFHLDLRQTVMNAVGRSGAGTPVAMQPNDFVVHQTEQLASAVTVLLLDVSRSMPMRGNFVAAKKVALALSTLIRTQFPRDTLYLVGFSGIARPIDQDELPYVNVGDFGRGTNMQGALRIARKLLARHGNADRQVLMVTDGEPSAFYDSLGRVVVEYPPGPTVLFETMREVRQCTKQGITINTFMLEGSGRLKGFVTELARANRGRVLFTSPDRLGRYVLKDFLGGRNRTARRG